MRKSLTYKILAAVLAAGSLGLYAAAPAAAADDYTVNKDGEIISSGNFDNVYGNGHSFTITGGKIGNVYGVSKIGYTGDASGGNVTINGNADVTGNVNGGYSQMSSAYSNTVNISGGTVKGKVYGGMSDVRSAYHNTVNISGGSVEGYVYGGMSSTISGELIGQAHHNTVNISGGSVAGYVYGGGSDSGGSAYDNEIIISGSADITNANLYGYGGYGINATGNTLTIDGWSGSTQSVKNFNYIAFKNISWKNNGSILTITNQNGYTSDLTNTQIKTINIAGGSNINVGESMKLIESEKGNDLGLTEGNVTDTFTAGVAREGLGSTSVDGNGNVTFKVNSIKLSSQAESAAQTRAASAAFVNQGTDLISDSLDTISRDDNYGVKTFAAVHGNRSKYDVADDIKINGWSTIVGVGNSDKFDNGSEFSWGVFYENGSGNYRTYNSFNNEFFRGDGSTVYNGGGIK